tara:strand:- start:383 stop:1813 length:1431 start_codon:yes stop_codon:yes gene_type:complete
MAINFGNQGYRRDLNLSETESETEAINNLGGAGISDDLRIIQNNLRNTSKIGFSTISNGFFDTGSSTVVKITGITTITKVTQASTEGIPDSYAFTNLHIELDAPLFIDSGHQVEIRNIQKSSTDSSDSILNGFRYVGIASAIDGVDGALYDFELPDTLEIDGATEDNGFDLKGEVPVISGLSTVRITPRDDFVFTKDDVVGLSTDVKFLVSDPGVGSTTLIAGRDYYVCDSDGLSQFKLSYYPSDFDNTDNQGTQVGIQTINVTGIDYTSPSDVEKRSFTFIRKDVVTQENLVNFIQPDIDAEEEGGFRLFRTIDDPDVSETLNGIFGVSNTILDDTRFDLSKRYQINKDIASTKDVKYEGVVIVKDPDQFNSGTTAVDSDDSPGVFIAGTRAFSSDNNPWTDEDELLNPGTGTENALVTRSEQIGIGEVKFADAIRIDGLGSDKGTLTNTKAGDYTHKLPVVINGETYFLLMVAN